MGYEILAGFLLLFFVVGSCYIIIGKFSFI